MDPEKSIQKRATQALTKMAYMSGSTDNVSVMLAFVQAIRPCPSHHQDHHDQSSSLSIIDE